MGYKWDDKKITRIEKLLARNRSIPAIAEKLSVPIETLRSVCRNSKIKGYPKQNQAYKSGIFKGVCEQCDKPFERKISTNPNYKKPRFCSRKCTTENRKTAVGEIITCIYCGKRKYFRYINKSHPRMFCSRECLIKFRKESLKAKTRDTMNVVVKDVIGGSFAITWGDGQTVYNIIHETLLSGRDVGLDFSGISVCSAVFLNAAIGRLLKDIPIRDLETHLKITANTTLHILQQVNLILENANKYYTNPQHRKAVDRVIRRASKHGIQ